MEKPMKQPMKPTNLLLTYLLLLLAFTYIGNTNTYAADRQPNVVLLLADDLGYGELGCQGNQEIPTPHIDSIAAGGVRFTNGYVTAAFCSASRAGLLTGRYQTRFGYEFNPTGHRNEDPAAGLPASQKTIADQLQAVGYTTALFGKWHLGGTAAYHPYRRGFDEFFGFMHEGHYFVAPPYKGVTTMLRRKSLPNGQTGRWQSKNEKLIYSDHMGYNEPDYDADNPLIRGGQPVEEKEYLTDALTREAVDFINRASDRPFFLYLPYNAVHSPLQGADRYMRKFDFIQDIHRRIFASMLANLDDSVGEVLAALEANELMENTIIVFLSDNGGPTRELTSSNLPLRGEKGQLYEGGIRVPFLMQWKGVIPAKREYHEPVISTDLLATFTALADAPLPKTKLDSVNLLPYILGDRKGSPHEYLYWRTGNKQALRLGDWKTVLEPGRNGSEKWQLYNLKSDLSESSDLASIKPEILKSLTDKWNAVNGEMIAPIYDPRKKSTPAR
jgi:arylsulfatase A-like enzyme|tara:strand:+ start:957 stop:2456 length:1500 start_codon:yes stop_codon:yes gene_type:complete